MPQFFTDFTSFMSSDEFGIIKIVVLAYFGILWLSIIIWVTRDVLARSNNILFQMFSILINIIVPILGVLIYLIIRPNKTHLERYYEEMQAGLLQSEGQEASVSSCEKCMIPVEKEYDFCPNCAFKLKKTCLGCKKNFPNIWHFCPFCGIEYKEKIERTEKSKKHEPKITLTES